VQFDLWVNQFKSFPMKIIAQKYKDGSLTMLDVPAPAIKAGGVLVRNTFSVISAGTEMMKVSESKMSLLGKARARPDQVRKVMQTLSQQGPLATYQKVMNRLDTYTPLGYSIAGVVEEVGEGVDGMSAGQRVACAGNQYALHAELNWVPVNLCVSIPDNVSDEQAAFTTVGSISMQGFRQSELRLGETAVVIGLGLLGQVLVRILNAAGVHVYGVDMDPDRCRLAEEGGATACATVNGANFDAMVDAMWQSTNGAGADCVFLTAAGKSNQPVELAAELARDRARIVDVGKCSVDLPWDAYAAKELEFRFSRSYGPGRYDPFYEEGGVDYPIGYVRWTEKRNMSSFMSLLSQGAIDLKPLIDGVHDFDEAVSVYERMNAGDLSGVGILFRYPSQVAIKKAVVPAPARAATGRGENPVRLGVIGCGNYANTMLLPHLKARAGIKFVEVSTTTPLSGMNAQSKFGFETVSTDSSRIFENPDVDAVLVLTPHSSHADLVCDALRAGKAVFVEKPLAINAQQLQSIARTVAETGNDRIMVGFNRRFSPILSDLKNLFGSTSEVGVLQYRVNAGRLDASSWHADRFNQGGRFVGEGCHFVDTASWWFGADPVSVVAAAASDDPDNLVATVSYENGAQATISYVTSGDPRYPKERMEAFGHGAAAKMDNFSSGEVWRKGRVKKVRALSANKGQKEQMNAFVDSLQTGGQMPIKFLSLLNTTAVTIAAEMSIARGRVVSVAEVLSA